MSVWWRRRDLEAAVLGELDATAEQRLFAHLRTCDACRAHYDTLSLGMDALSTSTRDARERARVVAPSSTRVTAPLRARPDFVIPIAVAVAAVAFLLFNLRPQAPVEDEIALRGGADEDAGQAEFSLLAYARRGDGPVRLAADLPLGGGSISRDERVQFFVRHPFASAHVVVTGIAPDGSSRALAEADVGVASEKSAAVGVPIDLSALAPGRWKIEATLVANGTPHVLHGSLEFKP